MHARTTGQLAARALVGALALWMAGCEGTQEDSAKAPTQPSAHLLRGVPTAALIDSLAGLTSEHYAVHSNIIGIGERIGEGRDQMPPGLMMMHEAHPPPSEAMRELVRRGASAVPLLVEHLSDTRPTKVPIPKMMNMWFGYEYDCNTRTTPTPPDVNLRWPDARRSKARSTPQKVPEFLAVGDICYDLLGTIVNRHFESVRYQPSLIIVINCPSALKEVREAATTEWRHLTPELHRQRLLGDVREPDHPWRAAHAIALLSEYYPEAVESAALGRLAKPIYCSWAISEFVETRLYQAVQARQWRRLTDGLIRKHGPAFRAGLREQLLEDRNWRNRHPPPQYKADPCDILAELFPECDPSKRTYHDAVDLRDMADFVEAIGDHRSGKIDARILAVFRSTVGSALSAENTDMLAVPCIARLIGKGHDAELARHCRKRLADGGDRAEYSTLLERLKD